MVKDAIRTTTAATAATAATATTAPAQLIFTVTQCYKSLSIFCNDLQRSGGGIAISWGTYLPIYISDSTFRNNVAVAEGGAIFVDRTTRRVDLNSGQVKPFDHYPGFYQMLIQNK